MYDPKHILYVDDPENQLSFKALFRRKFPIFTVGDQRNAKKLIDLYSIKIIIFNQRYSDQVDLNLLQWVKQYDMEIIRIFVYSNGFDVQGKEIHTKHKNLVHQYLWKPWKTKEMESVLLKWLE